MKLTLISLPFLLFALSASAQNIKLVGSTFDPNGAIVIGAKIEARSEDGKVWQAASSGEGRFELELPTGLYSLSVSATGFLTVRYSEYLIVNTFERKMAMDFVMFGALWHEPCGVSGANCLPKELLIKDYKVEHSPKLKDIKKRFGREVDKRTSKP